VVWCNSSKPLAAAATAENNNAAIIIQHFKEEKTFNSK
jgi:hypothetical protein